MTTLTSPLAVGGLHLKNRLVMPPMATARANDEGTVTQELCDYYAEKSVGGYLGLIIAEHMFITPAGKASPGQTSISYDADNAGLSQLTATIHHHQTPVFAQINHAGSVAKTEVTGQPVYAVSSAPHPKTGAVLPALTREQIEELISEFAAAAKRAQDAGFDGVEIHSAHGYLLNQFFSPLTNTRTDAYGGSLTNRLRIHREILAAVRATVGEDYPVALRLGACDYHEGGSTLQDGVTAARLLEQDGLDLIDISGGFCGYVRPGVAEQGYFSELTEAIKQQVNIPVLLTGGITEARAANNLLAHNKADLIGVGRAILKDSNWARRALSN